MPEFRIANLVEDTGVLNQARAAAFKLADSDPKLERPENQVMKIYFQHYVAEQGGLGGVA